MLSIGPPEFRLQIYFGMEHFVVFERSNLSSSGNKDNLNDTSIMFTYMSNKI